MDIGFSINKYDEDGDQLDSCLLLHINDTFILRLSDLVELDSVIEKLQKIKAEIQENYPKV